MFGRICNFAHTHSGIAFCPRCKWYWLAILFPHKIIQKPFQPFESTWAGLSKETTPRRSWRKHHANCASQQQHRWSLWNQSPIHNWVPRQQVFPYSATGTRTRVARVRAEYPNQLDYGGSAVEWIKINNKIIFTTRLVSVQFWSTQPDNQSSSDIQLGLDRAHLIDTVISSLWLIVLEGGANDRHGVCHHHCILISGWHSIRICLAISPQRGDVMNSTSIVGTSGPKIPGHFWNQTSFLMEPSLTKCTVCVWS